MLRALALTMFLALALATPMALADPIAGVGVAPGPSVVTDTTGPYYLFATVSQPEGPGAATSQDDCAAGQAALPPDGALLKLVRDMPLPAGQAGAPNSIAPYVPKCFATEARVNDVGTVAPQQTVDVRASYNFTDGRYYVDPGASSFALPGIPIGPLSLSMSSKAISGTTGVGVMADCELCPPPG